MLHIGSLNLFDCLLIADLCVVIPLLQIRTSLRAEKNRPQRSMAQRAPFNFAIFGTPLIGLALDWWMSGRSATDLGLAYPVPWPGQIGLLIALLLCLGLFVSSLWPSTASKRADLLTRLKDGGLLITSITDFAIFVPLALLIGCGTEILFRGFLFWAFDPVLGWAGAVAIMALAYGLGHGFRDWRAALGSLVSAILFALAYALTRSLWWLMLFHTFVALSAAWSGYRAARMAGAVATADFS
ncbi:MAG TPA: CPBP family intramembrane glutamic endopeptidase [Rhizomicrobium sp.]